MDPVKKYIHESWKSDDPYRFPGPQPISIERRHFPILKQNMYLVCEKTDGVRYILINHPLSPSVTLINRMFKTEHTCKLAGFPKDTILDGELVTLKNGKLLYSVYDAVRVKGVDCRNMNLIERLEMARAAIKRIIKSKNDPFEIKVKTMVPLSELKNLPPLSEYEYETDGIVITPVNEPIRLGTHETMFKWKPLHKNTVDFMIKDGKDLYVQDRGVPYKESQLHLQNEVDLPDGTIVECEYGDIGWKVIKVRTDKDYPNNRRTYARTCVNLQENIQLYELCI